MVENWDDVLRMVGDRGEVTPSLFFKELNELRFFNVGVVERSTLLIEFEVGAFLSGVEIGVFTGDEGGRGVAAAVPRDSRCTPFERPAVVSVEGEANVLLSPLWSCWKSGRL